MAVIYTRDERVHRCEVKVNRLERVQEGQEPAHTHTQTHSDSCIVVPASSNQSRAPFIPGESSSLGDPAAKAGHRSGGGAQSRDGIPTAEKRNVRFISLIH